MTESDKALPEAGLARKLARLWPHREHEANVMFSQFCRVGLHRWRSLDLSALAPGKDVRYCFWCSKIEIDGLAYDP